MEWEQAQSHSRTILMASMAKEKKKKKNSSYKRKPKASSCSSSCPKHPPVTGDSVCLQSSGEMWLCCFCAVNIPLMFPPSLTVHPATLPLCLLLMFSHLNAEAAGFVCSRFYGSYLFSAMFVSERGRGQLPLISFFLSENIGEIISIDICVKRS